MWVGNTHDTLIPAGGIAPAEESPAAIHSTKYDARNTEERLLRIPPPPVSSTLSKPPGLQELDNVHVPPSVTVFSPGTWPLGSH
jgi:hypothetical protein